MRLKGRYIDEEKITRTCPDRVVEIPWENAQENGMTQLHREIDAICMLPRRSSLQAREERKKQIIRKVVSVLGTLAIFLGAAAAVIFMAPALGTILFAVVAWCGFAGMMTEK